VTVTDEVYGLFRVWYMFCGYVQTPHSEKRSFTAFQESCKE